MPDEESAKKREKKSLAKDYRKCIKVKSADIPSKCLVVLGPCIGYVAKPSGCRGFCICMYKKLDRVFTSFLYL